MYRPGLLAIEALLRWISHAKQFFKDITMRFTFRSHLFYGFSQPIGKFSAHICSIPESPRHWRLIPEFPMKYFPMLTEQSLIFSFWLIETCRQALQWSHRTDKRMPVPLIWCKRVDFHRGLVKFPCFWFNAVARVKQQLWTPCLFWPKHLGSVQITESIRETVEITIEPTMISVIFL